MNSGMWDWTIGRADRAADEEAQESKSLFYKQPIIKRDQKISNPLQHLRVNGWMLKQHGAVTSDLSNPYHRSWEFQTQYQTLRPYQTISDHQDRNEFGFSWIWLELAKLCGKHWKTMPLKGIDLHAFHGNSQPQPKAQRSSWESTSCWGSFRASPALFLLMYPHCQLQCFQSSQRIQVLEHAQVL